MHRLEKLLLVFMLALAPVAVVHAAISLIAASGVSAGSSATTTMTVTKPAATATNDLLIVQVSPRGGSGVTITPPSGWSLIRRDNNGTRVSSALYYKVAGASEPATYMFTLGSSQRVVGGVLVYRGVDTTTPVNASSGQSGTESESVTAPTLTTTVANTQLLGFFAAADGNTTFTAPGGMTARYYQGSSAGPNGSANAAMDKLLASAGPSGAQVATASEDEYNIGQLVALKPAAASSLNNFLITIGAASASTCTPKNIQITARDAGNATLTGYTGTIALTTSSGHGDWSAVTANGALANGTADDGAASYGFVAGDSGSITLALSNSHADDLTISVSDSGVGVSSTSTTLNFRDNVFVITEDAVQVAGRNQAMSAALWRKDPATGNCSIATGYVGARSLKVWLTRDGDDPNGTAPTISAVSLPNAQPGTSNLSLNFSGGTASFNLASTDVGKYVLNLLDDTRSFATGVDIAGASNTITTRPFGLGFTAIKKGATTNPGGANPADAVFIAAGVSFEATVGGYLWQAADDADSNGVPDSGANITNNGLAPKFAWPVTLSAVLNTPVAGALGALGGTTSIPQASFSGGAVTVNDLTYGEVGSIMLRAGADNYLNTASADYANQDSGVVGRFTPDHFAVGGLMHGSLANGCGSFTYTGQMNGTAGAITYGVKPQFIITALNAGNSTTTNYTGTFAKLISSGVTLTVPIEDGTQLGADATNKVVINANIAAGTLTDNGDGTLTYELGADDFVYAHEANSLVGEFTSDIRFDITGIAEPAGADGVTSTITGQTLTPVGVEIRFGRLALQNTYGSELLDLPVNLTAEYYADLDGAGSGTDFGFVTNSADTCSGVADTEVTLTANSPLVTADTSLVVVEDPFVAGSWHTSSSGPYSRLTATGAGKQGSVDLVVDLDAAGLGWLKYDRDGVDQGGDANLFDDNPTARAVFGIYQGSARRIYMRERFN